MLTTIGGPREGRSGDELTGSLLDCHERIRRFTQLALKLCGVEPSGEAAALAQIAEAAAGARRYFTVALPLHSADEEQSVEPRLVALDPALGEVFVKMAREHREIEALIDELAPRWLRIAAAPERLREETAALARPSEQLNALFRTHLVPEETVVFPALARLAPEERAAILGELRARRRPK